MQSSFFSADEVAREGQLASLHVSRDNSIPVILSTVAQHARDKGYAEGVVTNTKFGSFPHSTLIGVPWGSQVRASKVDTGSRGRQKAGKKRKAAAISKDAPLNGDDSPAMKEAESASSGYIHLLPPTPENWTSSLPHRTQVVYTPDYSYILHRIRARPGSVLIEAGSGSGSFTHAAIRAVFNGSHPPANGSTNGSAHSRRASIGKVYTFEFHAERHEKLLAEMSAHGLSDIVTATHRDVYQDGFLIPPAEGLSEPISPRANAIFLDLPAPWEALAKLTRQEPSALDPGRPVSICTFSPCIEQVQKTISTLRRQGWLEIEMVEMQHRRLEVRREFTGLKYEGMRAVNAVAADVNEAVAKLREHEKKLRDIHITSQEAKTDLQIDNAQKQVLRTGGPQQDASKTIIGEGKIIHRSEPELKTHTSYLVFAILPQDWTEEDEAAARAQLPDSIAAPPSAPKSQRQLKKEAKDRRKNRGYRNGHKESQEQSVEQYMNV